MKFSNAKELEMGNFKLQIFGAAGAKVCEK